MWCLASVFHYCRSENEMFTLSTYGKFALNLSQNFVVELALLICNFHGLFVKPYGIPSWNVCVSQRLVGRFRSLQLLFGSDAQVSNEFINGFSTTTEQSTIFTLVSFVCISKETRYGCLLSALRGSIVFSTEIETFFALYHQCKNCLKCDAIAS